MKRIFLLAAIFFGIRVSGQNNCTEVAKENEYLRQSLKILTPVKSANAVKVDFGLVSVKGSTKDQTVEVVLTLVNKDAHKYFQFVEAKMIDVQGNEYQSYDINIGSERSRNKIFTDVPVKSTIVFKKILPSTKIIKLLNFEFFDPEKVGNKMSIDMSDIDITWR